ncbi:MAG: hypothetical protein ABSD56_00210 [Bryobacteraceae bacterium]
MRPTVAELEAIIRERVCASCDKRAAEASCGAGLPGRCPPFELFPLVAQAILATEGNDIQAYVEAIRENVCTVCIDHRLDGTCPEREQARCLLEAYMPQVIEAIQAALGRPQPAR